MAHLTRTQTNQLYKDLMKTAEARNQVRATMRELCQKDVFFLLTKVCGRADMDRDWIYERCREVEANPDGYLDLWAREHYKSTIITFGLTMRDILTNPEITVCILSYNNATAKDFLLQIKREFETNKKLQWLFSDILWSNPARQSPKWSEDSGIIINRKTNPKEPTLSAYGLVDNQPTGKHFALIVYDDVVTKESVATPNMINKVTEAWEMSLNVSSEGGRVRYIGTRYHYNDTYATMIERNSAIVRLHPATHNGKVDGKPVLWNKDTLTQKIRDMGSYVASCQLFLDPKAADTVGFKREWLRYWPAAQYKGLNIYILVDPANAKRKKSDYTSLFVVGLGADKNAYVITMVRDRLNLTERTNLLFSMVREYEPKFVGYEQYGMQADIQHINYRMEQENYRFNITELGGNVSKEDRIMWLLPEFEHSRIWLPETCVRRNWEGRMEDLTKIFVLEEYMAFPYCFHDDMLDVLSRLKDPNVYLSYPANSMGNLIGSKLPYLADIAVSKSPQSYDPLNRRHTNVIPMRRPQ